MGTEGRLSRKRVRIDDCVMTDNAWLMGPRGKYRLVTISNIIADWPIGNYAYKSTTKPDETWGAGAWYLNREITSLDSINGSDV